MKGAKQRVDALRVFLASKDRGLDRGQMFGRFGPEVRQKLGRGPDAAHDLHGSVAHAATSAANRSAPGRRRPSPALPPDFSRTSGRRPRERRRRNARPPSRPTAAPRRRARGAWRPRLRPVSNPRREAEDRDIRPCVGAPARRRGPFATCANRPRRTSARQRPRRRDRRRSARPRAARSWRDRAGAAAAAEWRSSEARLAGSTTRAERQAARAASGMPATTQVSDRCTNTRPPARSISAAPARAVGPHAGQDHRVAGDAGTGGRRQEEVDARPVRPRRGGARAQHGFPQPVAEFEVGPAA